MFKEQIALVTGGAQGIGLAFVEELLENGIQGVSVVDVSLDCGKKAEETLNAKFGPNKVIFIQADISQQNQLEDCFKRSFDQWKGLDILINNAAVGNEKEWEKTISINCMATVRATYLGFEYMSKLKGKKGGAIVNIASMSGLHFSFPIPTYSASKSFVITFTRALGHDAYYQHNQIRVVGVCPGATNTTSLNRDYESELSIMIPNIKEKMIAMLNNFQKQPTEHVAKCVMDIIDKAKSGSIWAIKNKKPPYEV